MLYKAALIILFSCGYFTQSKAADTLKVQGFLEYSIGKKIKIEIRGQSPVIYHIPGYVIECGPLKRLFFVYPSLNEGDTFSAKVTVSGLFYRHEQMLTIEYHQRKIIEIQNMGDAITCIESDRWGYFYDCLGSLKTSFIILKQSILIMLYSLKMKQ